MAPANTAKIVLGTLCALAIVASAVLGLQLRLLDTNASPTVLPAEDTYTHMSHVKEHIRDGQIDSMNEGGRIYPPGMHALLAAAWIYTGVDLFELMRYGPALFGALGVIGMGILLWRSDGPVAGVFGAVAYAVMHEIIMRTTMMAPTAVDLALLPFFLLSIIELLQGRIEWVAPSSALALFFLWSHPWLLAIVAFAGFVFIIAAALLRWPEKRAAAITGGGVAIALGILGVTTALSVNGCFSACGPGFEDILENGERFTVWTPLFILIALAVAAGVWKLRGPLDKMLRRPAKPANYWIRGAMCVILLAALVLVTRRAYDAVLPAGVNLPLHFGLPILYVAAAAFVLFPLLPSPAAHLGFGISLSTYPFVVFNPLNSPFWSHRTAAYLGVGLAILVGIAAGGLVRLAVWLSTKAQTSARVERMRSVRPSGIRFAVFAVLLLVFAGGVASAAPTYETEARDVRWYRLFSGCEHEGLKQIADYAATDSKILVVTGSWQSKQVISAMGSEPGRVWFTTKGVLDETERTGIMWDSYHRGGPLILVVDHWFKRYNPEFDNSSLEEAPWQDYGHWCTTSRDSNRQIHAYIVPAGTRPDGEQP